MPLVAFEKSGSIPAYTSVVLGWIPLTVSSVQVFAASVTQGPVEVATYVPFDVSKSTPMLTRKAAVALTQIEEL